LLLFAKIKDDLRKCFVTYLDNAQFVIKIVLIKQQSLKGNNKQIEIKKLMR